MPGDSSDLRTISEYLDKLFDQAQHVAVGIHTGLAYEFVLIAKSGEAGEKWTARIEEIGDV